MHVSTDMDAARFLTYAECCTCSHLVPRTAWTYVDYCITAMLVTPTQAVVSRIQPHICGEAVVIYRMTQSGLDKH
jgi:hypothetical protein